MFNDEEQEGHYRRQETEFVSYSGSSKRSQCVSAKPPRHSLTRHQKETVLSLKKVHDPFKKEYQGIFDNFIDDVDKATDEDLDLSEVGLLLAGVTKIYSAQVDSVVEDVHNLLAFVTRTKKASIEKKKQLKEKDDVENSETVRDKAKKESAEGENGNDGSGGSILQMSPCKSEKDEKNDLGEAMEDGTLPVPPDLEKDASGSDPEIPTSNPSENVLVSEEGALSQCAYDGQNDTHSDLVPGDPNGEEDSGISVDASDCLPDEVQSQIINEIPGPNTRKRSQLVKSILQLDENGQPIKKKPRNGFLLPPTLTSCFDELRELQEAGFMNKDDEENMLPPILSMAVRLSRKRHMLYTEDGIKLPKRFKDTIDRIKIVVEKEGSDSVAPPEANGEKDAAGNISGGGALDGTKEGIENEQKDNIPTEDVGSEEAIVGPFQSSSSTNFSSEDQTAIQECINELHYLPFTFELSKTDLASAFSRTVERMSRIFKKNNVQVTRNMVKEASVIAYGPESVNKKPGGSNGIIHPAAHSLGDIYNTFVKSCREECESFITNEKTILERTKEKSFAESRANIRAMIAELQRNIVPKFARVPLMAENTPEFFQHVTNFEKKMKRILEQEAKKEEFDVRKYERDVLEVTAKESSELDRLSEDFLIPQSPMKPQSVDGDNQDIFHASPSTRSSFDGSQSSSGSSWVPIKHIFQHMKSIDRTETARSFYAVLALLSYQNLDINYDQLYSAESAALITQQLQKLSKEEDVDVKYPRGVKIVNSRCPDVDKEEVFIAALTSESRDEAFRHLLAQESKNLAMQNGAGPSSSTVVNGDFDEGIAEAMADFVEESGSIFAGRLEGRKRKRKTDS